MKIRMQNSTLRVRLNEREVQAVNLGKELISTTSFPDNVLTISLKSALNNEASFAMNKIILRVAQDQVSSWASSEEVSIAMEFATSNEEKLLILVEKDMKV